MRFLCFVVLLALAACTTMDKAPVIERAPVAKTPAPVSAKPAAKATEKDWRPESYTVKKGDTLYSIGLEYGYDYKEIAEQNNIKSPYLIYVGQQLKLKEKVTDGKPQAIAAAKPTADNGVVVSPLKTEGAVAAAATQQTDTQATTSSAGQILLITEPKALREPYSEQAMAKPTEPAKPVKPAEVAKAPETAKPTEPVKPEASKPDTPKPEVAKADVPKPDATGADDESVDWSWPTNGKVIAGFSEATNAKGVDIAGNQGQAVTAAAPGKVIYSGSDLRGYGKLVIIKHNKTYLSVYAHNSQILVKEGQQVNKGEKIAEMGNSDTDRVKLHFEIRKQGKSVDPSKYLPGNPG